MCLGARLLMAVAVDALFEAHRRFLWGLCYRMTGSASDADDIVQDTFVRALRFYERFERGTNLKAWLLRVQFNGFVNKYRRSAKELSAGEAMTQADVTVAVFWLFARGKRPNFFAELGCTKVDALAERLQATPAFQATMPEPETLTSVVV